MLLSDFTFLGIGRSSVKALSIHRSSSNLYFSAPRIQSNNQRNGSRIRPAKTRSRYRPIGPDGRNPKRFGFLGNADRSAFLNFWLDALEVIEVSTSRDSGAYRDIGQPPQNLGKCEGQKPLEERSKSTPGNNRRPADHASDNGKDPYDQRKYSYQSKNVAQAAGPFGCLGLSALGKLWFRQRTRLLPGSRWGCILGQGSIISYGRQVSHTSNVFALSFPQLSSPIPYRIDP